MHSRGVRHTCVGKRQKRICISIHAPARGATERVGERAKPCPISIHAPARGATANLHKSALLFVLSIYLLDKRLSIFWLLSALLFPRPFILPFLSANLAGNSRPLGVRTAPKSGKSCDILRAASPSLLSSISDKLFHKKANQNRVCQLKRERPARKRPVSASLPQPIPKSRKGVFKPFLPLSQPVPIPAASRPFIFAPGERPGRWPFPKRLPRPGGLAHGRSI